MGRFVYHKKSSGFTLVELLIVMAIIGILATIAIPTYLGIRTRAAQSEAKTNLEVLRMLQEQFYAENGVYTASAGLDGGGNCVKDTDNIAAIKVLLPAFRPGNQLLFSYCLENGREFDGTANADCYRALAVGNTGTPVAADSFIVDCNNDKNY